MKNGWKGRNNKKRNRNDSFFEVTICLLMSAIS